MPITLTSDRIVLTDGAGITKFDTDEGLFVSTDYESGTFSLSAETATATSFGRSNINKTNVHLLATGIATTATHIFGLYRTNWTISNGSNWSNGVTNLQIGGTRWRNANATGVDMLVMHPSSHRAGASSTAIPQYLQGFSLYTFYLSGGSLYCKERIMLQSYVRSAGSTVLTLQKDSGSLDYRLYIGQFV